MEFKKDKYKGLIGTLFFHGVLVLLLLILGFTTSLPLPGEEGVEVNLGSSEEGTGAIQPENPAIIQKSTPPPQQISEKDDEETVTQDIEPAPAIEKKKTTEVTKKKVQVIEKPEKEEPKVNQEALYKGKSKESVNLSGQEANEGITGNEGDQGQPNGNPDSKNYTGTGGSGNGTSFSLSGRSPRKLPEPEKIFQENGTVVVQITVDKYGKVVIAMAIDKGSNTTNSVLRRLAEDAAKKAIFNVKDGCP